ncbi:MAG: divergent PAP2 family protein [Candidatus Peribacteraceae bacterium]|nr:divergent PAP2 family protein [Candidatus Peribacteraceae bacterium]
MHSFFSSYLFIIPLFVGLLAEVTKILMEGITKGTWHEGIFRSGGMPSSHSALVTSLLIVVGKKLGVGSTEFAIGIVFACIVWYDAVSSRRAIGEQAKVLNRLQHWEHFSERLGHSLRQVIGGIVFGTVVTYLGIWMLG